MLDRPVAQVVLNRARVVAAIGELVAARMPQHVNVNREAELGLSGQPLDVTVQSIGRERSAAFAGEYKLGVRALIAPELAQRAKLVAVDRMSRWLAVLGARDVKFGRVKIDL